MKLRQRAPNTWQLTWELGRDPATGKRKQRTETFHGSKKDAEKRWRKVQAELDAGVLTNPARYTVNDLFDRCLRDVWPLRLKPSSLLDYQRKVEHYLRPAFGHIRLTQLTPDRIQAAYAAMQQRSTRHPGQSLAPKTLQVIHAVLRAALVEAERWGWITRNPARLVRLPSIPERELQLWTLEQWHRYWQAIRHEPWAIAVWLAVTTGMREGEILGLRWIDVDWDQATLRVEQTLIDLGKSHGGLTLQPPKTKKSRRVLPIDAATVAALRHHKAVQAQERLVAGWRYQDHGLVVQTAVGTPYWPRNLLERFRQAAAANGLPVIRFHDLRHLHASYLLGAGIPIKVVQERLGHARIQTTLDIYGHLLPGAAQTVTDIVEHLFGDSGDKTGVKSS